MSEDVTSKFVIAHQSLKNALSKSNITAGWQRCFLFPWAKNKFLSRCENNLALSVEEKTATGRLNEAHYRTKKALQGQNRSTAVTLATGRVTDSGSLRRRKAPAKKKNKQTIDDLRKEKRQLSRENKNLKTKLKKQDKMNAKLQKKIARRQQNPFTMPEVKCCFLCDRKKKDSARFIYLGYIPKGICWHCVNEDPSLIVTKLEERAKECAKKRTEARRKKNKTSNNN
mmetsp:Transcript_2129/g.3048  ORF Transcript_2129/g.3048 Transcript_2129/m.3048 type:complete len:227 (+) Transcript_2129:999-1679(+)